MSAGEPDVMVDNADVTVTRSVPIDGPLLLLPSAGRHITAVRCRQSTVGISRVRCSR